MSGAEGRIRFRRETGSEPPRDQSGQSGSGARRPDQDHGTGSRLRDEDLRTKICEDLGLRTKICGDEEMRRRGNCR